MIIAICKKSHAQFKKGEMYTVERREVICRIPPAASLLFKVYYAEINPVKEISSTTGFWYHTEKSFNEHFRIFV